jgi:cytochrome c5
MRTRHVLGSILLFTATLYAQDVRSLEQTNRRPTARQPQIVKARSREIVKASSEPDGDAAYKANCARCHAAPRKLSDGQTATIMLHMRARANLTAAEADAILKYLVQ